MKSRRQHCRHQTALIGGDPGHFIYRRDLRPLYLVRSYNRIHPLFLALTALTIAIVAAASGIDMAICLAILTFAPAVSVIGYELVGYRHQAEALGREGDGDGG